VGGEILISIFFDGEVEILIGNFLIDVSNESATRNKSFIDVVMTGDTCKHGRFATSVRSDEGNFVGRSDGMMEIRS
jgi:hypothetical protein